MPTPDLQGSQSVDRALRLLSLVGRDIFEKLVKGYTEKQWGRDCKDLPASIITPK